MNEEAYSHYKSLHGMVRVLETLTDIDNPCLNLLGDMKMTLALIDVISPHYKLFYEKECGQPHMNISLNEASFRCLVRGDIIHTNVNDVELRISLQDIGFDSIKKAIELAERGEDMGKNYHL